MAICTFISLYLACIITWRFPVPVDIILRDLLKNDPNHLPCSGYIYFCLIVRKQPYRSLLVISPEDSGQPVILNDPLNYEETCSAFFAYRPGGFHMGATAMAFRGNGSEGAVP